MKWWNRWEVLALGSAFFASLTAILGKIGVANINSNLATLIRTGVVLILTAFLLFYLNQWQSPGTIGAKTWIFLALSGLATGLSWLCYYRALQLGLVSKVASLDKLSVALAVLLGVIFLGEKLSWPVALGAGLITMGAILIALFS